MERRPPARLMRLSRSAVVGAGVLATLSIGLAAASIPSSTGVLYACYATKGGAVRLVQPTATCGNSEQFALPA
jgi:hypothetical protein